MKLVEQHVIKRNDPRFAVIDAAAFKSKNLYNAALYEMRQAFIHQGVYLSYEEMDKRLQPHEAYKALPAKVSQQVLRQLADAWKAFREAKADSGLCSSACTVSRINSTKNYSVCNKTLYLLEL